MSLQPYFTVPKILESPQYDALSLEARYLYARMRDLLRLSIRNGWRDEIGYYIKMTRETIARLLKRSLPTVRKIICQLVRANLIVDRRMGLTKSNRIYIKLLDGETIADLQSAKEPNQPSGKNQGFKPDRKPSAPNNHNPKEHNPSEPKNKRWFVREGDKWFENDTLMWLHDGDIEPYPTRRYLSSLYQSAMQGI